MKKIKTLLNNYKYIRNLQKKRKMINKKLDKTNSIREIIGLNCEMHFIMEDIRNYYLKGVKR